MKKLTALLLILSLLLCGCGADGAGEVPKGEDIVIALLDTGVSATAINGESLRPGYNYVTNTDDTSDRINHGTAVASVIIGSESAGVEASAPDTKIIPLVVADKVDGEVVSVSADVLAGAIRDCVDKYGAYVINVSLGIKVDDPQLCDAIRYVQEKGAIVISAVGNGGENGEMYFPAAYKDVLAVGSHDKNGEISDFTQQNGTADILAPGEDIWLASRNGKTYGAKGTSYATGYVSAAAALLWQAEPELSAVQLRQKLLDSADSVNGWLILNVE